MAEVKPTTIRFSEDIYRRLEQAGQVTGLPINSIVVVACLEWLDAHQTERRGFPWAFTQRYPPLGGKRSRYPFDRFTERAKRVLTIAQQEAERSGQGYIGDEHLLLALLEGEGLAAKALKALSVGIDQVREQIQLVLAQRKPAVLILEPVGVPPTPFVKKIIEAAWEEARQMDHDYVGTEHLLLGIFKERDTVAATVLTNLGITEPRVRTEIERLLPESGSEG